MHMGFHLSTRLFFIIRFSEGPRRQVAGFSSCRGSPGLNKPRDSAKRAEIPKSVAGCRLEVEVSSLRLAKR